MPDADRTPPAPPRPSPWVLLFGSGLLSGYVPIASGTVGSLVGLAVYLFVPGFSGPYIIMPLTMAAFLLGIAASEKMEAYYGPDPAQVTIDEVVGMWVSLMLVPRELPLIVAGFFLFRLFDIVKPPPARRVERMGGGFGIMMDDVIAGFYTNVLLHLASAVMFFTGLSGR